jgi:hypothetical protein
VSLPTPLAHTCTYKQSEVNKKNLRNILIGTESLPRLAFKCRMQHCIDNTVLSVDYRYCTLCQRYQLLIKLRLFFQNLPFSWALLAGNGNMAKTR